MKYIQILMKSYNNVSHNERKAYLNSLWGSPSNKKKGSIMKFCTSIGFKPVMYDICTDYPIVHEPTIEMPENYTNPEQMLYKALWVDMENKGIVKFVVPIGDEKHFVSKYTYNREDICKQFVKFLKKVYPNIQIEMTYLESFRYTVKTFVLNHFYQCMDFKDSSYTVECSAHRLLTNKEIEKIYQDMDGATDYKWHIEQFYCETCKAYHSHAPYHIEVVYER